MVSLKELDLAQLDGESLEKIKETERYLNGLSPQSNDNIYLLAFTKPE